MGFECTVSVDDVDAVAATVRAEGGEILTPTDQPAVRVFYAEAVAIATASA